MDAPPINRHPRITNLREPIWLRYRRKKPADVNRRPHLSSSGRCNDRSFPALLARRSAVRVLPHQRIHNGFGELVRVPRAFGMRSGGYQPAASKRNRELLPAYLACSRVSSKPVIMTSPPSLTCPSHPSGPC